MSTTNLEKLTLFQFIEKYKQQVRVNVEWGDIYKLEPNTDVLHLYPSSKCYGTVINHPWSKEPTREGGSLKTKQKNVKTIYEGGKTKCMVRVPAVKYKDKIMLLDGNHRVSQLKPMFIIIDLILIETKKQARSFSDLYGKGFLT